MYKERARGLRRELYRGLEITFLTQEGRAIRMIVQNRENTGKIKIKK